MDLGDSSQLITIGEFARLGGVSIKALRLYAEIGLLQPAAIKAQSRYRLYSRAQLSKLHRILMLKNAGLALAQIGGQLSHRDPATLSKIRAGLISRADEIQQQLAWVDAEIRAARNRTSAVAPVVVKHTPEMRVLSDRHTIDSYDDADGMLRDLGTKAPKSARLRRARSGTIAAARRESSIARFSGF
jgi:DNA-binding transcriptional MerR regulator